MYGNALKIVKTVKKTKPEYTGNAMYGRFQRTGGKIKGVT